MKIATLLGGIVFGFGLSYSWMAKPEVVLSFLQLKDMGLLLVLLSAALMTTVAYQVIPRVIKKPLLGNGFGKKKDIFSKKMGMGAIIFGVGWGISGLCPGTALASFGMGNYPIAIGIAGMFLGAYVNGVWLEK